MQVSGDNASLALANKRFEKRNEEINKYEKSLGLPPLPAEHTECEYLTLNGEEITKFTPEQCGAAASILANYALYVQRVLSRERGILRWLDSRINLSIANELNNYTGYYSHDQRRAVAISNNEYAKALEEFKINSQLKVDILDGLTYQINQLCRVLLDAQSSKRQQKNY
jgi:hypothetical protein